MNRIELKTLVLKNFKGIRDLTLNFNGVTNIYGENASGKTTINDAFRWLLFDKDSTDRKNFEIKTLDENNNVIHGLEHSVTGELSINGKIKVFKKIYKEKWQKRRQETESQFTGHETLYYINDVPVKASEYQVEISEIVDETIFKLITDPLYFSQTMKWQDRRTILLDMVGDLTPEQIFSYDNKLEELRELMDDSGIDKTKVKLSARRRKLNDEIKSLPYRIDECYKSIVELDFKELKDQLNKKIMKLGSVEEDLMYSLKENPLVIEKRNKLSGLRNQIRVIEDDIENDRMNVKRELSSKLRRHENQVYETNQVLIDKEKDLKRLYEREKILEQRIEDFRKQWDEKKAEQFIINENFECPTCHRKLDVEVIENKTKEMLDNFNKQKAKSLELINKQGKDSASEKKETQNQIAVILKKIEELTTAIHNAEELVQQTKSEIEEFNNKVIEFPEKYYELKEEVDQLTNELDSINEKKDHTDELVRLKSELRKEIESINSMLHNEENNKKLLIRIDELKDKERELAQQIADLEKQESLCDNYIKTKVELLESRINSRFSYVRFKLFETQINGALVETCQPLINGVPFSDANNAAKYNAGIDIINALSEFYDISAPIFIDNREGINEILSTSAQIINLIVSHDKFLKVA